MPKNRTEKREVTRKEHVYRRRDYEADRRLKIGLGVVAGLLVLLIGGGLLQELVIKPSQPIAVVNGQPVSAQDYAKRVRFAWFQEQQVQDPESSSVQVLDQMIDEQIIRDDAKARGLTVTQDEVDTALEQAFGYQRYTPTPSPTPSVSPTPEPSPTPGGSPTPTPWPTPTPVSKEAYQKAYQDFMAQAGPASGMTDADLRTIVEVGLLREKLYAEIAKEVPTAEEAVKASHILVAIRTPQPTPTPTPTGLPSPTATPTGAPTPAPTPTPVPPRTEDEAVVRMLEVQRKLAEGIDFATLAKQYSDDPGSAAEGGDLGWIFRGATVPEFEAAVFTQTVGVVGDPVKTDFGVHLIKVEEKDPNHPLEEFSLEQKKYTYFQEWMAKRRQEVSIQRNWSLERVPPTPVPSR